MNPEVDYNSYERKVILSKGYGTRFEKRFFEDIQNLILEGWRIIDTGKREDSCMRNYKGTMGKAVLFKAPPEKHPLEEVERLEKKQPLLDLAKEHDVEIPEDIKQPAAIKKYLRKKFQEKFGSVQESPETTPKDD